MILGFIAVLFFILFAIFFIMAILVDVVNRLRGKPSHYTKFFFLYGDSSFLILILAACIVFLFISLFGLYICLKHLFL